MKKTRIIDLTKSSRAEVKVEELGKDTAIAAVPRAIRKRMIKSNPIKIADAHLDPRTVKKIITHYPISRESLTGTGVAGGNKMKGLGKGDYEVKKPNTPKQIRAKNFTSKKKG